MTRKKLQLVSGALGCLALFALVLGAIFAVDTALHRDRGADTTSEQRPSH